VTKKISVAYFITFMLETLYILASPVDQEYSLNTAKKDTRNRIFIAFDEEETRMSITYQFITNSWISKLDGRRTRQTQR